MDYYKSPSIQVFEKAASAVAPLSFAPGVATVGFSTRGPINELMHFRSYDDFEKMMGKPLPDHPLTHMMARRIFATGAGTLYFVRAGNENPESAYGAKRASVRVTNATKKEFGRVFIAAYMIKAGDEDSGLEKSRTVEYLLFKDSFEGTGIKINVQIGENGKIITELFTIPTRKISIDSKEFTAIHLDTIVKRFNLNSDFAAHAIMKKTMENIDGDILSGLYIETKNFNKDEFTKISFTGESGNSSIGDYINLEEVEEGDEKFAGLLGKPTEGESSPEFRFTIEAKHPGSGMNGVSIVKKMSKITFGTKGEEVFDVNILDDNGKILESFIGLKMDTFISRINDDNFGSSFITINVDSERYNGDPEFSNGTYVLGKGTWLVGDYYSFNSEEEDEPVEGTDGIPTRDDEPTSYNEIISDLLATSLRIPSLANMDNVFYSIIATPDSQDSFVQDAAIELAVKRGDTFYIADVPQEYNIDKSSIKQAISWHNGDSPIRRSPIESSYAGVYYGWTTVISETTGNNIYIPPSVLVVPRMLLTDANDGVFSPPAGARRGRVIAVDYLYSPDMEDRELMMGGDNCINPIIYSNTRGLMIYGQKTADRTGSALNRINVRRMVNRIKANLHTSLDVVRFELNNSTTRERARTIVSEILLPFRNAGALETFTVNVQSPGGAERDVLNVYVDFVPVGLVERIRVFINITEGGVSTIEA